MNTVTVPKERLRATLVENLAKHEAEYKEGYENWQKAVLKELSKRARQFKKDPEGTDLYIELPNPQSHVKDYQDTLDMLDWEKGDEVTLSRADFTKYVNDDWPWKSQFMASNTVYAASAGR